jgi:gliding motility-associated-like protein
MRFSKYLIIFFLSLGIQSAFSQSYTVTSTADEGTGTLREAIIQAPINLTTGKYTITFNLPGDPSQFINRTIRLRSQLPAIPSNVVIDGSTQASWPKLGVSGAKIIIEPEYLNSTFSGLVIGINDAEGILTSGVEIYGLYLRNFARFTSLQNLNTNQGSGIVVDYRANNLIIGAPGKGNVIGGNINGILIQNSNYYQNSPLTNITIQSNLIGVLYDGTTAIPNITGISASLYDSSITIGGDNSGDGNVIAANPTNINITRNGYSNPNTRFEINIINNKIGTDFGGTKDFHELPLFLSSSSLEIYGVRINSIQTQLYMRKNVISGQRSWGVYIANADFVLTGNNIGTGTAGTEELGNGGGIKIELNSTGTIGGATAGDANLIAYSNYGIESNSSRPVSITRNSFFCNRVFGIGKALNNFQPFVQILKKSATMVSGRATPNSDVELFITQNCEGLCEGRTYIGTTTARTDGRWDHPLTANSSVTATASLLNATTSQFSTAALLENEAIVEPVTCASNGSVTIAEPREGMVFTWNKIINNGSRVFISNSQSITNQDVGSYELIIDDGCKAIAQVFEIKDQKLTIPLVVAPTPTCGQLSFQFTAEVLRGKGTITYQWINAAGTVVATGASVALPQGTYKVKVSDQSGCVKESEFATVTRLPAPIINLNNMSVTAAACGQINGSIKNITVTDLTGTASYKWFLYDTQTGTATVEVTQSLSLENVAGGYYVLEVTDQSTCSPVRTSPINISIYNSVSISFGDIKGATCNTSNGSISGILIAEADTYEWFDSSNRSLEKGTYSPGMVLRLIDRAPGTYVLVATNSLTGCTNNRSYVIVETSPQVYAATVVVNPTTCNLINGSIVLTYGTITPARYVWKDASGTVMIGTASELKNLSAGSYTFYAYDINNCETVFGPYIIEITPLLAIIPASAVVVDDGCTLKRASVMGIKVIGGIPEYNYKWIDAAGAAVQYTQDLINVGAGTYRLVVTDKTSCGTFTSDPYTVNDYPFPLQTPAAEDIRVCYVSDITLPVIAPEEGTYQLFTAMEDAIPLYESNEGVFRFKISKTGDYYLRRILGSCISEYSKVHIEVTNDNLEIMNTFTPNGDGMNDTWLIKGLPDLADINVKLYARSGQLVFESIGKYATPFDGRFRGKELPAGVYYFRIDLRADCKPLGGSLTLLR